MSWFQPPASSTFAIQAQVPIPSGSVGLILFVMYLIFGPGNVLFQLIALIRYYLLDKTYVAPEATIRWPTDPKEIRIYLVLGILVTVAPFAYSRLIG
jgi:hypothetical protein